jgi:serine/threonine protein kinase
LEFDFQKQITSDNVVKVRKQYVDQKILLIEMECAEGGNLLDLLKWCLYKRKVLSFKSIWMIFIQLLKGIDGIYIFIFILFYFYFILFYFFKL